MSQISEHINSSNHKIYSYDQMSKMRKQEQLSIEFLLMIFVDTPENYLSNVDHKLDMRKVRTSSVKSLSTLFSCSIHVMYNKFY